MGNCMSEEPAEPYKDDFTVPETFSTPSARQRQILMDILAHPQLSFLFREFLRSNHCDEGYMFFMDVENFRMIQDQSDRKKEAQEIFDKFFCSTSQFEINIEGADSPETSLIICIHTHVDMRHI
eukprot:TRINITY_DN1079_c0_g1_i1.p1 TRINITY_DN1079_c0_g1~~TRINITY_DN1079_c0_g1_i1.p1  ORF type:complete len:124 (-),score=36.16 TRINITY_DN1079_c0_g1_i1:365-736(-)